MRIRHVKGSEEYVAKSPLVIQRPEDFKGSFSKEIFGNDRPLRLEVGMGMGTFIRELSKREPKINFIGFELNTTVLYKALRRYEAELSEGLKRENGQAETKGQGCSEEGQPEETAGLGPAECADASENEPLKGGCEAATGGNLRFIRSDARFLSDYFAEGEIDRIYLNFSDPWPKDKNANKRLTSPIFLAHYMKILRPGGLIEFKTDNRGLFDYSVETINASEFKLLELTYDLHHDPSMNEGNIMTEYEQKFSAKGNPIFKLIAERP